MNDRPKPESSTPEPIQLPYRRDEWMLDPQVHYLNHGAYGATPYRVFEESERFRRELELSPANFFQRRHAALLDEALRELSRFLGASSFEIAFVPNTTFGMNVAIRSCLSFSAGDEVIVSTHEYGAVRRMLDFWALRSGITLIEVALPAPFGDDEEVVSAFQAAITPRTKALVCDHITSPTALILPVRDICRLARERNILSIIDGAHAPGHIPVDLGVIDADFYIGNLHKWLSAPKGAAFLAMRSDLGKTLDPLVIGWGWKPTEKAAFRELFAWPGTHDPAAYFSVPAAIQFQADRPWEHIRNAAHAMLCDLEMEITEISGLPSLYREQTSFCQMMSVLLPLGTDSARFRDRLFESFHVETAAADWEGRALLRISFTAYNSIDDCTALLRGLKAGLHGTN